MLAVSRMYISIYSKCESLLLRSVICHFKGSIPLKTGWILAVNTFIIHQLEDIASEVIPAMMFLWVVTIIDVVWTALFSLFLELYGYS